MADADRLVGRPPEKTLFDILLSDVAADPEDPAPKLVLADYLEDGGDEAGAEAMRWAAARRARPNLFCPVTPREPTFDWWLWTGDNDTLYARLPGCLFALLKGRVWNEYCFEYPSAEAAYSDLLRAWRELDGEGRAYCKNWRAE